MKINIFWFRRDLRLEDNTGLNKALTEGLPVLPLFIFDTNIISELPEDDARINFIYERLLLLNNEFRKTGSSISIYKGDPEEIWKILTGSFQINAVFTNRDYEPYGISRDKAVSALLREKDITFLSFKDQVIFEGSEILKPDNKPYTIFTPYKKRWLQKFNDLPVHIDKHTDLKTGLFYKPSSPFPFLEDIGFRQSQIKVKPFNLKAIHDYDKYRDYPFEEKTSLLSPYLRFGITSIRSITKLALTENQVFLNELIWREFFMQILYHFPHVISENFKPSYDDIHWRNNEREFERWCNGETGYPIVDAGMRQLNKTGFMHNRIRMITAGFLCKHLLIDWRWGEAYFAQKLLDYELSSNNGNWQWAAGTGCDAAPYFRVFNPAIQQKKFDPGKIYIKKWVQDFGKPGYPEKIVDHDFARQRAITTYKTGIKRKLKNNSGNSLL